MFVARAAVTCALTLSALASGAEHLDFHVERRPNQPRHQTRFRQESSCRGLVMKYFPICITLRSVSPEIDYLGGCVVRSGPSMFACRSELSETRRLWICVRLYCMTGRSIVLECRSPEVVEFFGNHRFRGAAWN